MECQNCPISQLAPRGFPSQHQDRQPGLEYHMYTRPISECAKPSPKLTGRIALIPASYSAEEVRTFGSGTSKVPMLRAGQPCEVAPCYVFLASEDSCYMTGQVLHPNSGTIVGY